MGEKKVMLHEHPCRFRDAEVLDIVGEGHAHLKAKELRTVFSRVSEEGREIFECDSLP
jgi:hypothetical protein